MSDEKTPEVKTPAKKEKYMYLGPNIINPVFLSHRTIFSGYPESLSRLTKTLANAVKDLFVPLASAGKALAELKGDAPVGDLTRDYKKLQKLLAEVPK